MMAERDRIKLENPDAGFGELGKLAGAEWKALSDSAKQPYIQQSEVCPCHIMLIQAVACICS